MMGKPEVDIKVDDQTGRWSVDALPMILVPQHFYLNNHFALEAELGPERLAAVLHPAGFRSAHHWCEKEAAFHGLDGEGAFRHYLRRLSQRGWGQFSILALQPGEGRAEIRLDHSAFVDQARQQAGRKLCYVFASWFEGALVFAAGGKVVPRLKAGEVQCVAEGDHTHCLFHVEPAPASTTAVELSHP